MEKSSKVKQKVSAFFDSRPVRIIVGVLALVMAYVFASLAIDSGSLLDYAIMFLFIIVGVRELIGGIRNKK